MKKYDIKTIIEISLILIIFILFSYIIQTNLEEIQKLIKNNILGMIIYVLITILAIVIAPISTLPLLPIASNLWGANISAVLSIIGWTIGALIAFIIARKYGVSIIQKFISLEKIYKLEKLIPQRNVFWSVVFLRMIIPVDILSYALGLFSKIKTRDYFIATLIGVTPFAFVFSYLGVMPLKYQIPAIIITIIIIFSGIITSKKYILTTQER